MAEDCRIRPVATLQYKSIAALLNFEESGAVLLPLLGRCSRPPRPKSFEEFIHLSPRQIHNVCAIRGGIEIPYHDDHSLAAGDLHDGSSDRDKAGAGPKPARRRIRVTSEQTPRPPAGRGPHFRSRRNPLKRCDSPPCRSRSRQCDSKRVATQDHERDQPPQACSELVLEQISSAT